MIGEAAALASALCWAASSIIYREALKSSEVVNANLIRCASASIALFITITLMGRLADVGLMDTTAVFFLGVSTIVGLGLGDTAFFKSLTYVGVSMTVTISSIYPLFTIPWAVLLLHEDFSVFHLLGAFVIVMGVVLVSRGSHPTAAERSSDSANARKGFALSLAAALAWSVGVTLLKMASRGLNPFVVNLVRMVTLSILLLMLNILNGNIKQLKTYAPRTLTLLSGGGLVGITLGGTMFLASLELAGAVKAVPLSSIYPIFSAGLAAIVFKEKVTAKMFGGMILVVLGTALLSVL